MSMRVTITVELGSDSGPGAASTQVLTERLDNPTQALQAWAASAIEHTIAEMGARLTRQAAALYGDMRDTNPAAPGFYGGREKRPLTGPVR